ncbi:MAG: hypothetical protein ACW99G_18865 [Candidatus Thorarchaeota archaeon]
MSITLAYTTADGSQEKLRRRKTIKKMNLSERNIKSIDLTQLISCVDLQELYLDNNKLQSIDLSPLSSCTDLEIIGLRRNKLKSIDITPLVNMNIEVMLTHNKLDSIDTTPLLDEYSSVWVDSNCIQYSWIRRAGRFGVYRRPTSPWPPVPSFDDLLHQLEERGRLWSSDSGGVLRKIQDQLAVIGLGNYGFIERDVYPQIRNEVFEFRQLIDRNKAQNSIVQTLLNAVMLAIENNGSTTGLHLDVLSERHVELAEQYQDIIDLRQKEMDNVRVGIDDSGEADLSELWLTAHGYEILTTHNSQLVSDCFIRKTTDSLGLEQVKKTFAEFDHDLRVGNSSRPGVKMSNELKECIWWIVNHWGMEWREIYRREAARERGEEYVEYDDYVKY